MAERSSPALERRHLLVRSDRSYSAFILGIGSDTDVLPAAIWCSRVDAISQGNENQLALDDDLVKEGESFDGVSESAVDGCDHDFIAAL